MEAPNLDGLKYLFLLPVPLAVWLVFLVLKLCGTIDWSWWWVNLPLIVAGVIFELLRTSK